MMIKNSSIYVQNFLFKISYSICSFLANALLARNLGPELKGEYACILNMASIISVIMGWGIYQSIPFYNRNKSENEDIIQTYINIFTFQFIIYCLCGVLIIAINENIVDKWIIIISILDIINQEFCMLMLIVNINKRNVIQVCGNVIYVACCLGLYIYNIRDLDSALIVFTFTKIIVLTCYLYSIRKVPNPFKIDIKIIIDKIKFGYLPMLSLLLMTLNYKVDILMLKACKSIKMIDIGIYSVGVSIAELVWFIPDVFREVLFNKTAHNDDDDIISVIRVSNYVMLAVAVVELIFGKHFIVICYGKEYLQSFQVLLILLLGVPAMAWFKIIYTLFNAQGKRKTSFSLLFLSAILNIIVNYLIIPVWEIYGAALASVCSYAICGFVFLYMYSRMIKCNMLSFFIIHKSDIEKVIGKRK